MAINKRAGLLREALMKIHRDSACKWSCSIASAALDKDDDIKEEELIEEEEADDGL